MKVTLFPNESLVVDFFETDGEFEIHFDTGKYTNKIVVEESGGLPGNVKGEAKEILYEEDLGGC